MASKTQHDEPTSKTTSTAGTPAATPAGVKATASPPAAFRLPLDEFCTRLSAEDKRVEMIGAFHHQESAAGRKADTHAAFLARFTAFCSQPA
jgi:alpha-beta hydrolase superfamily lysophospholipase